MKPIIILLIMLILGIVSAVGFSENKIIVKDNGEVKQITQNERLQKVEHMKELKQLQKPLQELKRNEMKSKVKGTKNKNLVNSADIINIDLSKSNNKTMTRKQDKAYNVYGGVERENLNSATIQIQERLIAISDYENSNEEFKVTLYTGENNQIYNIYRHQDISKNTDEIRRDGDYLKSVISYNGYITYFTNDFSIQSAQLIQDISLIGTEQLIIELSDYFINYDSVRLNIYENNIFIQEMACGEFYLTGSAIYTEQNIDYTIDCSTPTDIILYLNSNNVPQTLFNSLRVFEGVNPTAGVTENFFIRSYEENTAPQLIQLFPFVNLDSTQEIAFSMKSFFSNFEVIEVTTPTGALKINGGGSSQFRTYTSNDMDIWLDYLSSSDTYLLSIFAKNKDYNFEMIVTAKNFDETLFVSDTLTISTNYVNPLLAVTYPTILTDRTISGVNSITVNMNNYFSYYDSIIVNYEDTVLLSTIQLEKSKGEGFAVSSSGDITATLTPFPNTVVLTLTGTNIDLSNKEITVRASNEVNFIEDTFLFSTTEQVISTPSNLDDGLLAYWTLDNVLSDESGNENTLTDIGSAKTFTTGKINEGSTGFTANGYYSTGYNIENINQITISMWVKFTTTNENSGIFMGGANSYGFFIAGTTKLRFGAKGTNMISTADYNDGNWHHIVGVKDAANAYFYINGVLENSITDSGTFTSEILILGNYQGFLTTRNFGGVIDEPSIWNRALSQEEITELYNNNAGNQYPFTVTNETAEPEKIATIAPITITGTEVVFISLSDFYTNYNKVIAYNSLVIGAESVSLSLDDIEDEDSDCAFGRFTSENEAKYEYCLERIDNDIILKVSGINLDSSDLELYLVACDDCTKFSYPVELESIIPITTLQGESNTPYFIATITPFFIDGIDSKTLFLDEVAQNYDSVSLTYLGNSLSAVKGEIISSDSYNDGNIEIILTCIFDECNIKVTNKNKGNTGVINVRLFKNGNIAEQNIQLLTTNNPNIIIKKSFWDYLPSWFPQEEQAQKTTLAISIIVLACGFVFITPQEQTFKYPLILFVLVSLFILFAYLGWFPAWLIIIMIILTILLGFMFFRGSNNG